MSIENIKKLETAVQKLCHWDDDMTDEENLEILRAGGKLLDEISKLRDPDILNRMFDFFEEESADNALGNGVCETLGSQIDSNFSMEQVIEALDKKFSKLVVHNEMRAVQFAGACLNTGNFIKFQEIFNKTKSPNSENFLNRFTRWYIKKYPEEIAILREDMKKW